MEVRAVSDSSWSSYLGLLLAALLTWLDGGTISTALPTITAELDLGPAYVWVAI